MEEKNNAADILRWLQLKSEDELYSHGVDILNHIKVTGRIAFFWGIVMLVAAVIYMVVASFQHNVFGKVGPIFNVFHFALSVLLLMSILMWSLAGIRIGKYSAVIALVEFLGLGIMNVVYTLFSSATPDLIEKFLDRNNKLEKAIEQAIEDRSLLELAKTILRGYLSPVAFAILTFWLILILPISVFANPAVVLLSVIAIIFLVFAIYGWNQPPFWMEKIQTASLYLAAGYVIFNLAVIPFLGATGVFEGWGPAGHLRTGFWFVVVVLCLAIAGSGFSHTTNQDGKTSFSVRPANAFVAAVILVAALLFGNLALNTIVSASQTKQEDPTYSGSATSTSNPFTTSAAPTTSKSSTVSTFVDAKAQNGVDSGIYLKKGSTLEIDASGTAVWKDIPIGNPSKYQEAGPDGTPPDNTDSWDGRLYGADLNKYLCPTANKGALIAKIGNGPWFKVGKKYKGEITTSGKLFYGVNDVDVTKLPEANWYDNKKGFTVETKVS